MRVGMRQIVFTFVSFANFASYAISQHSGSDRKLKSTYTVQVGEAALQIDLAAGDLDLPPADFVERIQEAAFTVARYYGRFPVRRARILIVPIAGAHGIVQGTTWGNRDGFPGFTRLRIGQHTTKRELATEWVMTHELVHMAFASLPDDEHWLEEGIATYVEPIARAQVGELTPEKVWGDMVAGMPAGEPGRNDLGMNRTHTWGRTYWGGALFCLMADVEIRKQTDNRKGLRDALRAITSAGGPSTRAGLWRKYYEPATRPPARTFWRRCTPTGLMAPVMIDLDRLWSQLGVDHANGNISINPVAPLSRIRVMLTTP